MKHNTTNHKSPYEGWREKVYQTLYHHTSETDGDWMTTKELWEKSGKRCSIPTMLKFLHAVHETSGNVLCSSGRHGNEWRTRTYEVRE